MTDLITTLISYIPSTVTAISAYKAAKPFLEKIAGPAAEELGEVGRDYVKKFRADNAANTLAQSDTMLKEAAIEPQPVAPKVLIPLLEAASLEDDEFLSKAWAALLANAANPISATKVEYGFVEIMKQLTPLHILILSSLLQLVKLENHEVSAGHTVSTKSVLALVKPTPSQEEFDIATDNLIRLHLCGSMGLIGVDEINSQTESDVGKSMTNAVLLVANGKANLVLTSLGLAFVNACTPPSLSQ